MHIKLHVLHCTSFNAKHLNYLEMEYALTVEEGNDHKKSYFPVLEYYFIS